ncbi:hypothetical protein BDP27DRAFT_1328217 [Rhodocollybia butyracea]|uniref:DUF6534 domain-containing protein n=1 Tax=Rhodocollybia butyracea TaxID=206335 RepID=A0A9P5U5K6_9AGAR|nr:hypothetical protein BDP27DRAFT_1328217 [Rhodocollybia butyracea]
MSMSASFQTTLGAVIIGFPLAAMFSGLLIAQCIIYFRSVKPTDTWRMVCLVCVFLFMDLLHLILLWDATWEWFIVGRGKSPDHIPPAMGLSVVVTGISTFFAHSVYSHRIFRFSRRNYWLTTPIMVFAALRVVAATVSTVYMVRLQSFEEFRSQTGWVFSTGLALSCAVDILISGVMTLILKQNQTNSLTLDSVISSLVLYTLETGSITAVATIASCITWACMKNLIFLALHFIIAKLYANSVLAMLNSRQSLRLAASSTQGTHNAVDLDILSRLNRDGTQNRASGRSWGKLPFLSRSGTNLPVPVEVNVTKTMTNDINYSFTENSDPSVQHESKDRNISD